MAHVLIVGGGNAGFCAAHAAVQAGATATILEKAPPEAAGGNSFYTAGAFRVVHGGLDAVLGDRRRDDARARVKDGRAAAGIEPPKSHWAQALDTPPSTASRSPAASRSRSAASTSTSTRACSTRAARSPGSTPPGELVGGLFHGNYPGGTGLTAGAVFGRRAGTHAA